MINRHLKGWYCWLFCSWPLVKARMFHCRWGGSIRYKDNREVFCTLRLWRYNITLGNRIPIIDGMVAGKNHGKSHFNVCWIGEPRTRLVIVVIVLTIICSVMIPLGCLRSFYPSGVKVILSDSLEFVLTAYFEMNKLYIIRKIVKVGYQFWATSTTQTPNKSSSSIAWCAEIMSVNA